MTLATVGLLGGVTLDARAEPAADPTTLAAQAHARRPVAFEPNVGQTDGRVKFLSRHPDYDLFLTATEAVLALRGPASGPGHVLRLQWLGARTAPSINGRDQQPAKVHYLEGGDPAGWRRNVPTYGRVTYQSVYPGIDLVFYGREGLLEHDFVVAPGADPRTVRLAVNGADRLEIDAAGDLVIHVAGGEVRLRKPFTYQEAGGTRREVPSAYRLLPGEEGAPRVGFTVGAYDRGRELVIDPVLAYSTYLGGSRGDWASDIAVDAAGNAYITGTTGSVDFPVTPGALDPTQSGQDVFLTKLDPRGNLVYSTYLGGSWTEVAYGVTLDAAGNIYLTGHTDSPDFPRVGGLSAALRGARIDAYITKLAPSGSTLLYSTTFGGSGDDRATDITVDAAGSAFLSGWTDSRDFPRLHAVQGAFGGGTYDAFAARLTPSGAALAYATYLGGSGDDFGNGIAVDPAGRATLAGMTRSRDFPTREAAWSGFQGGAADAFMTQLDASGSTLVFSTYLGGSGEEGASGIVTGPAGDLYVAGGTDSPDFPVLHPLQGHSGDYDGFVTRFDRSGIPVFSTFFGGSHSDGINDLTVGRTGRVYIVGGTHSKDLPLQDPLQATCDPPLLPYPWAALYCWSDAFVAALAPDGRALLFSTFLGGSRRDDPNTGPIDVALAVAVDSGENLYVTGESLSSDFPTVKAFQPTFQGAVDSFVVKISPDNRPPGCSAATASPATLWPPNGKLVPVSIRGITDPEADRITLALTGIHQDEPLTRAGVPDASGLGSATALVRADRAGSGDGRVYHLSFTATDTAGGTCTGRVTVCVPHDQRRGATCGDGGALIDSVQP